MRVRWRRMIFAGLAAGVLTGFGAPGLSAAETDGVTCAETGVCRVDATKLPLRVLARPFSAIYKEPADNAPVLSDNVRAFFPLFVFERKDVDLSQPTEPKGWYRVGPSTSASIGWMAARDAMEWRQALVLAYTHPGKGEEARKPVLMFKGLDALQTLASGADRAKAAQALYDKLAAGAVPDGVISSEPDQFINIDDTFYVLPVIQWQMVDLFDDPARYLLLAAAVPGARAQKAGEGTFADQKFLDDFAGNLSDRTGAATQDLRIDVVFVLDMTSSMQPYIDSLRDGLVNVVKGLSEKAGAEDRIRFGLIGYRDELEVDPKLQFVSKNFTPELVGTQKMIDILRSDAKAAEVGSGDYAEEVYAGFRDALDVKWSSEKSLRLVFLVGDASAHPVGHPQNTTGLNAEELRLKADQTQAFVVAVYLKAARAQADWQTAMRQFGTLARNPGQDAPTLTDVSAEDAEALGKAMRDSIEKFAGLIDAAVKGDQAKVQAVAEGQAAAPAKPATAASTPTNANVAAIGQKVDQALALALINYLGKEADPPRDITAWVLDRDLVDPRKSALSTRVLVTRQDMDDLTRGLEFILDAIRTAQLAQMEFFDALQALSTGVSQGQKVTIERTQQLSKSALLPSWIESLPYKSDIAAMSPEMFEALSPDQRYDLELRLDSKLQLYRELAQDAGVWREMNPGDPTLQHVYPLPLAALP